MFGYDLCKQFAKDNINIVLVARKETSFKEVSEELERDYGIVVVCIAIDLSAPLSEQHGSTVLNVTQISG